jgi:hypothetical protein
MLSERLHSDSAPHESESDWVLNLQAGTQTPAASPGG